MKTNRKDKKFMQKIVIISRESALLQESYYREIIEDRQLVKNNPAACHLMQFIVEQLIHNKEGRNNYDNTQHINNLIGNQAPQAEVSIYRTPSNTTNYIKQLVDYYLENLEESAPYITISDKNSEIIILLWNRVPIVSPGFISRKNRLSLVLHICKDCGIVPQENPGNILYIHDEEWGIHKDVKLYTSTMKGEDISESEYSEMKHYFDAAIAFQHISVDKDITTYDLIRHGTFDSSKMGRVKEIDDASGKPRNNNIRLIH